MTAVRASTKARTSPATAAEPTARKAAKTTAAATTNARSANAGRALDLPAAHRPLACAALREQLGGPLVLFGLGGRGRIAATTDGRPGLTRELVLAAVLTAATDGARITARLAGGD